ncbi:MAG: DNA repair protein RecO [Tannerella sp.]|jgi:DNA repair protein RecO (recombination protein O)|nr:DNA repair protein RecO [Tannerella sp.]
MLFKTRGIILRILPYNDKYNIINMFTEDFGRVAYLVYNNAGKRSKVPRSVMSPLSILNIEAEHFNNRDIHRLKEARPDCNLMQLSFNPSKNAIALFLSEVLYRILQEKEPNLKLFNYLYNCIHRLEVMEEGIGNFHLTFLFKLSNYLGINPNKEDYRSGSFFDLQNGIFTDAVPYHNDYLSREDSIVFARLLKMNFENMSLFVFSRQEKADILRHIITYYRIHLADFPEIKSLDVMQSLFD